MRAVVASGPGGPDVLRWGEAPDPVPGPDDVLIDVAAAGLNNADLLQRRGGYPVPQGASPILGLEVSGRIAAVGSGVHGLRPDDEVCALLAGGGYAERVAVPAAQVLPVPDGVGLVEAAGLMEAACTVHSTVAVRGRLAAGETLLVQGGGGGIGTFAVQWGAAVGARVIATAGSARKRDAVAALGADVVLDHRRDDLVDAIRAATGGRGVDVVLDVVGAPALRRNLESLASDGRLLLIGGDLGDAVLPLGLLMRLRGTVGVTALRSRPAGQKAAIVAAVGAEVWPHIAAGRIRPIVDTVLPMREAAAAHRLLETGGTIGKVLLETTA